MEQMEQMEQIGENAREASRFLAKVSTEQKNIFLKRLAEIIDQNRARIIAASQNDVRLAEGLSSFLIDRLTLNETRINGIISDVNNVSNLPDPVGERFDFSERFGELDIHKQRTPIGVVAVIYESRPNVTIDSACLLIKSGNACILKGGKETIGTNTLLNELIQTALRETGFPPTCVQSILSSDRAIVGALLKMDAYVDMLIPRGGQGLHEFCRKNSSIPVITGGIGVCHIFVDESADLQRAIPLIENAKVQRPTVCNALETLLIHENVAEKLLPPLCRQLAAHGVSFHGDEASGGILSALQDEAIHFSLAKEGDFDREWLTLDLSIRIVTGLDEAIAHIQAHGTGHSDSILTEDGNNAERFIAEVNSAAVYVNASTRFTDGSVMGLGAEIAISTQPLHARGPMALRELTTYKWVVKGNYSARK